MFPILAVFYFFSFFGYNIYFMDLGEKFSLDLIQGQKGEEVIKKYLEKKGFTFIHFNNNGDYDIKLRRKSELLVEVKTDRYGTFIKKTDNMFIETSYRGKLSGPWKSKADLFFYYFPDEGLIYFTKMNLLKAHLKNPYYSEYISKAGDGGMSSGFKLNRKKAEDFFKIIKLNKKN